MPTSVSYQVLSDFLIENRSDKTVFYDFVKATFGLNQNSFPLYQKQFDQFIINHDLRWKKKSKGRKQHFLNQYGSWLENYFCLKDPSASTKQLKPFDKCSTKTEKRRMNEIIETKTVEEIQGAYLNIVRDNDKIDADIIANLRYTSPECKENIMKLIRGELSPVIKYSPDQALALMVDLKLTSSQYNHLHMQAKHQNGNIYPPYSHIFEAKKRCYPPEDSLTVTDYGAAIDLQALVDHTTERLFQICDQNKIRQLDEPALEISFKWGLDGASGQSLYKQTFTNDSGKSSDASMFMVAMVPLLIKSHNIVIWKNPQPSSTKFCRPIKFDFMKETPQTTNEQFKFVDGQIDKLRKTTVVKDGEELETTHRFYSTMVDGKTINYLAENPSQANCNICRATPKEMNDFDAIRRKECNDEVYAFGISPLHCWIRFLECILHISYRLKFEKWMVCNAEDKKTCAETKERIQLAYRLKTGK